jgi:anti-sigma28 factor (negative regulator of flagellin synthesis)
MSAPADRVSLAASSAAQQVREGAPSRQASRVAQLASQVAAGTYTVSASKVASHLLDDASLTAQVQAIVGQD